ncbi:hypothetical protein LIER_12005 [Lithospermum erythrorhizon]|uniref:DUF4228 domain protein n=1 Tax=Lithospermum erythrorhizon TaxID=34254 RepID=A0AAV3PRS9_LITER
MGNHNCIMPTCPFPEDTSGLKPKSPKKPRKKSKTRATIKLIRADGIVKIYHQPIKVSELVLEFPKHMVCNSDSFYIGQKIPALSQNDKLKHGNSYFVLPNHLFQSVLSVVSITSFLASSRKGSDDQFKKALLKCQPFHIQKTPSGILRVNVSDEFISRLMDGHKDDEDDNKLLLCTTKELKKDYAQLVGVKQWKPKLETIKEKKEKKKKVKISFFSSTKRRSKNTIFVTKSRNLGHSSSSSIVLSPKVVSKSKMKRFLGKGKKSKQRV